MPEHFLFSYFVFLRELVAFFNSNPPRLFCNLLRQRVRLDRSSSINYSILLFTSFPLTASPRSNVLKSPPSPSPGNALSLRSSRGGRGGTSFIPVTHTDTPTMHTPSPPLFSFRENLYLCRTLLSSPLRPSLHFVF